MSRRQFTEFFTKDFMWVVTANNPGTREDIRAQVENYMNNRQYAT